MKSRGRREAGPLTRSQLRFITAVILALVSLGLAVWIAPRLLRRVTGSERGPAATFVGRAACASCHERETKQFTGSRHDLAMQPADSSTVLGDFAGGSFTHFGVTTRFARRGGRYFVTTDGPDGKLAEFRIEYTFGVFPLQQYLVALPGGRYQALSVAWDSRSRSDGGQRWFHLYPAERIPAGDILHWSGPEQNWNYMCAECHSTNLKKNWRADSSGAGYVTTYSEIDVSCEACHGPGSRHVTWGRAHGAARRPYAADTVGAVQGTSGSRASTASMGLVADLRAPAHTWVMDAASGIAHRDSPRASTTEIELCARCHSRRTELFEDYRPGEPLMRTHKPALLDDALYFADGQQREEVYEYGSFLQSRMYAAGVSCGDCHDPHGLRIATAPDQLCAHCHSPARFATEAHSHHAAGSRGASCVACHMPNRNYMVVDARRDHSFRVPRPDLTRKIGSPNACNGCHADRSTAWAEHTVERWYPGGRWTQPHYGEAIDAGRRSLPGATIALSQLLDAGGTPGIVRATAAELLADHYSPAALPSLERALQDADGMVRSAALDAAAALAPEDRLRLVPALLSDSLRVVRIEAASALAGEAARLGANTRATFDAAIAEYREAQATNADRPESYSNLGALDARLGLRDAARREYEKGLGVGPWFTQLWINLAELLREDGDDSQGEHVLRRGLAVAVDSAAMHHALGLNLARQQRAFEALAELKRSVDLAPDNTRYAYVYGVALLSSGRPQPAIATFESALARQPADHDLLIALATMNRDLGHIDRAREYARRLVVAAPEDAAAKQLLDELTLRSDGASR
jgi:tetratricopeptide (TPR) repeat protein